VVNFESQGLGQVRYYNAEISGLSLPEEVNFGVAWQLGPRLSLGAGIYSFYQARLRNGPGKYTSDELVRRAG
jgi:hypothetical protein